MRLSHWAIVVVIACVFAPHAAKADADLFKERCAKCHARASVLARNLKGQTTEDKATALDTFLKTHHADDAQVREKIIAYLTRSTNPASAATPVPRRGLVSMPFVEASPRSGRSLRSPPGRPADATARTATRRRPLSGGSPWCGRCRYAPTDSRSVLSSGTAGKAG